MPDPPAQISHPRWPTGLWVRPTPVRWPRVPPNYLGPLWCLFTLVSYSITAAIGIHFVIRPQVTTPIWPADGLAVAILCRCPRRHWPWVLLGIALALFPENLLVSTPIAADCWFVFANITQTFLAASIISRFGRDTVDFSTVGQLLRLLVAAGPLVALTSLLTAAPVVYFGLVPSFWHFWRIWFVSDGLRILVGTPVLLSLASPAARRLSPARTAEAALILLTAALAGLRMFGTPNSVTSVAFDFPFVVTIPLIIWAALRTNLFVTSLVSFIYAAIALRQTVAGRGPFAAHAGSLESILLSLQIVIIAWTACGLAISGAVMQHRNSLRLLSASEDQFRRLATSSPAAIVQTDESGACVYVSARWQEITGQPVAAALGQGWTRALHPDDVPDVRARWRQACQSVTDFVAEFRVRRPNGQIRWVNARLTPLASHDGAPKGHVGIVLDVTDRMSIEAELDDRRRFNALVADLSASLINVDADQVDQAVRDGLVNLAESLDLDRVSLSQRTDDQQLHMIFGHFRGGPSFLNPIRMDTLHPWAWQRLNAGETISFSSLDEVPAECAVDKTSWIARSIQSLMLVPISIGGADLFVFAVATTTHQRNWSDELALRFRVLGETFASAVVRARADHELRDSETMLRKLNTALLRAEESERRRLATALHDELAQNLFAAIAQLVALRDRRPAPDAAAQLDPVISSLDESLRQTRELTFDLCPPVLYQLGLAAALQRLADQFQKRHGLICKFSASGDLPPLDTDLASLLYQSTRELLTNVIKHASATGIGLRLNYSSPQLQITVSDNGIGLPNDSSPKKPTDSNPSVPPNHSHSGFGLLNIRERLRTLGGKLEMSSTPGNGCSVSLILPVCTPA